MQKRKIVGRWKLFFFSFFLLNRKSGWKKCQELTGELFRNLRDQIRTKKSWETKIKLRANMRDQNETKKLERPKRNFEQTWGTKIEVWPKIKRKAGIKNGSVP